MKFQAHKSIEELAGKWIHKNPDTGCWLWTSTLHKKPNGYGIFSYKGKKYRTHRLSLSIKLGRELLPGECALHSCDIPCCVNPDHLFVGSHADNMRDAADKKRFPSRVGTLNGRSKLTEANVLEIRALLSSGVTQKEIGKIFGVTQALISLIANRRAWV